MPKLRSSKNGWMFHDEAEVEDWLWMNLGKVFDATPLKRQHCVSGQFCDILAINHDRQLIVIELKNQEDRYVVQQLTRYYHALIHEKPYSEQVDYSRPVRLIAIAPSFHRDSWIDKQYNKLSIEFFTFEIIQSDIDFTWRLQDLDRQQTWQFDLPIQSDDPSWSIPPVPRKLLNNLASVSEDRRNRILHVRETLLRFDSRMKETVSASHLLYGKGKTRSCAEFHFGAPVHSMSQPKLLNLLLWLPHPERKQMCRMAISTKDWSRIDSLCYYPASRRIQGRNAYWSKPSLLLESFQLWNDETQAFGVKYYRKLIDQPDQVHSLDLWVEIALEHWLERI